MAIEWRSLDTSVLALSFVVHSILLELDIKASPATGKPQRAVLNLTRDSVFTLYRAIIMNI